MRLLSDVIPKERCDVMIKITPYHEIVCACNFVAEVRGGFISFLPAPIVAYTEMSF